MKASNATSSKQAAPTAQRADRGAGEPANGASSSSTAERFRLTGPSLTLDPRIHAYRDDIADIGLAGQVFAPHYARPLVRGCGSRAGVRARRRPTTTAEAVTELLPGEDFAVLEYAGGWAWGYCLRRPCHRLCRGDRARRPDRADPHRLREMRAGDAGRPDHRADDRAPADGRAAARHRAGACLTTEYGCVVARPSAPDRRP